MVGLTNRVNLLRHLEKYESADVVLESLMSGTKSLPRNLERRKLGELEILSQYTLLDTTVCQKTVVWCFSLQDGQPLSISILLAYRSLCSMSLAIHIVKEVL